MKYIVALLLLLACPALAHDHAEHTFTDVCEVEPNYRPDRGVPPGNELYRHLYHTWECGTGSHVGLIDIEHDRSYQLATVYEDMFARGYLKCETEAGRESHCATGRIPINARDAVRYEALPMGPNPTGTGWAYIAEYQLDLAWNWDLSSGQHAWPAGPTPDGEIANIYLFDAQGNWVRTIQFPWLDPVTGQRNFVQRWFYYISRLERGGSNVQVRLDSGTVSNGRLPLSLFRSKVCDLDGDGVCGIIDFGIFKGALDNQ